jgi:hypothetical protein
MNLSLLFCIVLKTSLLNRLRDFFNDETFGLLKLHEFQDELNNNQNNLELFETFEVN